jgi:hypothetical protein
VGYFKEFALGKGCSPMKGERARRITLRTVPIRAPVGGGEGRGGGGSKEQGQCRDVENASRLNCFRVRYARSFTFPWRLMYNEKVHISIVGECRDVVPVV